MLVLRPSCTSLRCWRRSSIDAASLKFETSVKGTSTHLKLLCCFKYSSKILRAARHCCVHKHTFTNRSQSHVHKQFTSRSRTPLTNSPAHKPLQTLIIAYAWTTCVFSTSIHELFPNRSRTPFINTDHELRSQTPFTNSSRAAHRPFMNSSSRTRRSRTCKQRSS